jgi:hypothetical protein
MNNYRSEYKNVKEVYLSIRKKQRGGGEDDVAALVKKQKKHFPKILKELQANNGEKISHWIWWVFPTTKKGLSEPEPRTHITATNALKLLENTNLQLWIKILQIIKRVHPSDKGRIKYFFKFWLDENASQTKTFPEFYKTLTTVQHHLFKLI